MRSADEFAPSLLLQAMKMSLDFKAQVWYIMCKTSERSVRLYSQRLVQAEESEKKKKERESSLLLPGLQRCLTFSAWPSKGSVVFDPSLHFSLEFLSPFLLQTPGFWLTLHTLGLLPIKKSQQNYCVSLNPRWKIKKDISSDIEKSIFFFFSSSLGAVSQLNSCKKIKSLIFWPRRHLFCWIFAALHADERGENICSVRIWNF